MREGRLLAITNSRAVLLGVSAVENYGTVAANTPAQIDEFYFSGRRKYVKGRVLQGDLSIRAIGEIESPSTTVEAGDFDGSEEHANSSNHTGCIPGSVIVTDKCSGYSSLRKKIFAFQAVDHSKNYVNPGSEYHTP
eukprot:IDg22905t1